MKISYNWLKQFISVDKTPHELSLILTNIGLEVENLERVQPIVGGLEGLLIAQVVECEQHPNADKLRLTKVDLGKGMPLQVVCGAPNVAEGQKVVLAPVGVTVYPSQGKAFKIKETKIRGELSQGMICAEDEIGLGKSRDGIMVLPENAPIGIPAKSFFKIEDDFVFEIGLTPNRADAASHLGVARDIAAYLRCAYKMPDLSAFKIDYEKNEIKIQVEAADACIRYSSLTVSGVTVKPSPGWLQDKLRVIGLRPINNIVDITNYVLHELGQPLHAFDADKIAGKKVLVKHCVEGTVFTTLDDVERKLSAEDLMICDAEKPLCIAGVFGGKHSGVNQQTTNVFLESACFSAVSVRKSSKRHGLKTDASFRFERATDPQITQIALKRAALLIKELAGGAISSSISDIYPTPVKPFEVEVKYERINNLIGKRIPKAEIKAIITALGIVINKESQEGLSLKVPTYKVDVTRECDVVEEILRIYGYNNIAIPTKINASLVYTTKPNKENVQNAIADMLTANGFLEICCNSLTKEALSKKPEEAVKILNPLSTDLNIMRQSLLQPALESVEYNQNRKNPDLKFFEFGKTYHFIKEQYVEREGLLVLICGAKQSEQWNQLSNKSTFFNLKAAVDGIMNRLGLQNFQIEEIKDENFAYGLKYFRGRQTLVAFGAVTAADRKQANINQEVFYADFNWAVLLNAVPKNKIINKEASKYPSVRRDLSVLIDETVTFEQLKTIAFKTEKRILKQLQVFDVYQGDKLPTGKKSYGLSFILQDEEQTLADEQTDAVMQKIIANLTQNYKAEIRK